MPLVRQRHKIDFAGEDQVQLVRVDNPAAAILGRAAALDRVIRRPGVVDRDFFLGHDLAPGLHEQLVAQMMLIPPLPSSNFSFPELESDHC